MLNIVCQKSPNDWSQDLVVDITIIITDGRYDVQIIAKAKNYFLSGKVKIRNTVDSGIREINFSSFWSIL